MRKSIFISSTFVDLANHRKKVWDLLRGFDVFVQGMEQFGARTETPLETCIAEVEQADIYVGIIAFRLGSIEATSGKSYTQLEYERAQDLAKETLIYLIDEENLLALKKFIDIGTAAEKLEAFKRTLRQRHTVETFVSPEDLVEKLGRDLQRKLSPSIRHKKAEGESELHNSAEIIKKFLLVPKKYAGREVLVEIQIAGEAYPASGKICSAFNYEMGATVGVPVKIVRPVECAGYLDELYLDEKQVDEFMPIKVGESRAVFVKLLYSADPVDRVRARYKDNSYYAGMRTSVLGLGSDFLGERINLPADAKMALALSNTDDLSLED